jgi:Tfp pilus assembly protein PilV
MSNVTKGAGSTRDSSFVIHHSSFFQRRGFTFVEVLAAMLFLAILVPAIVAGLSTSNRAAVMAERSAMAAELAEDKMNELLIASAWTTADSRGNFGTDYTGYRWEMSQTTWEMDNMIDLTLEVFFTVQGREHSVSLSTLVSQPTNQTL